VRNPDYEEFREWQEAAEGAIRIVTLAPETEGAIDFIAKLSAEGVIASIGHTATSQEAISAAVAAGARLSTHLGNGSNALIPRLRNYIWNQLAEDRLSASIIADGFHLPDDVLKIFARAKGLERLILVSDVAFLAGSPPGTYNWGDIEVEVNRDGHLSLKGTEFLAGAGHLLDRCIARFADATKASLAQTISLCTLNPARLIGLPQEMIEFVPGTPACLTKFRPACDKGKLTIETCVISGEVVYSR
jgi:N-acetylglucosamine-6-phosphate deacetylase